MGFIESFQTKVVHWFIYCFNTNPETDKQERYARMAEEAIELAQAGDLPEDFVLDLVRHIYSRPKGVVGQEVGGLLTTVAVLCAAEGLDMDVLGETELNRVLTKVDLIREKQKTKLHVNKEIQ